MDLLTLHSTLQFPTAIVMFLVGLIMLMRWQAMRAGDITEADPSIVLMVGLIFKLWAIKQGYWAIETALRVNDLDAAADVMRDNPSIAMAINMVMILAGLFVIGRAALHFFTRRLVYPIVIAALLTLTLIGATLTSAGKGP